MKRLRVAATALAAIALSAAWTLAASVTASSAVSPAAAAPSGLEVKLQHLVVSKAGGRVLVVEMWNLIHPGNRPVDLQLTLPAGARDFKLRGEPNATPEKTAAGFRLPGWVKPGENTLAFSYALPVEGREVVWSRSVPYPVQQIVVLVDEGALTARGGALQARGPMEFGNRRFSVFTAGDLKAGAALTFTMQPAAGGARKQETATPASGSSDQGQTHPEEHLVRTSFHGGNANVRLWMRATGRPGHAGLLGVFLLTVTAVALIYAVSRLAATRRLYRQQAGQAVLDESRLEQQKRQLIREIAELDRRRARGEIEEEPYLKAREQHKRRLVEIMLRLKTT